MDVLNKWMPLLIPALIVVVVVKRMLGERLDARDVFGPPVVLIGVGVHGLTEVSGLVARDVGWLAAGLGTSLGLGAARAATTRLYPKNGELWQRYTWLTLLAWAGSAVIGIGLGALAASQGVTEAARPMTLSVGASLLGEAVVVGLRARSMGVPFGAELVRDIDRRLSRTRD